MAKYTRDEMRRLAVENPELHRTLSSIGGKKSAAVKKAKKKPQRKASKKKKAPSAVKPFKIEPWMRLDAHRRYKKLVKGIPEDDL